MAEKRFIKDIEEETGEKFDFVISDYYESCVRTGHYDMVDNAKWFIKENNLDNSEYQTVLEALEKLNA